MTFLKAIGAAILKGLQVVLGVVQQEAPIVQQYVPGAAPVIQKIESELTLFANTIVQVEAFGQALSLPGPQKLIAAAAPIEQIVMNSEAMVGKKIANPDLFNKAMTGYAQATADWLNSLDANAVVTGTNNAVPTSPTTGA